MSTLQNLHHTQVARASKVGDQRRAVMSFVHTQCKSYIATERATEAWSQTRFKRFRSHVAEMYLDTLRDTRDKTFAQDPTGERAIQGIMKTCATL